MSKVRKVLGVLLGVPAAFCLFGTLGLLGYYRFDAWYPLSESETRREEAEGRRWGTGHPQLACAGESMRRRDACSLFACDKRERAFARACLSAAAPSAELCLDIPPPQPRGAAQAFVRHKCYVPGPILHLECEIYYDEVVAHCGRH